ncbi:hypothetical protein CLAFUW4_20068 [Fulvia fulva]|uniref:uncharacterized protein n=1 Tax=Passalora fulva TaxID=5499 RepID=UPI002852BA1F|nr:uncharacterized protein CLAFUR5_20068 [Fulvia fulva]KAK4618308.1 hypothetical protein CLAFUR4_20068 [Fulvia fulva]KAK4618765.1 hypothetical protein CLAFUR0_20068 [Fulvia fulva]WMI38972.1 hypothetical protein CLAFUR5_20068 [Fulvia fulva]WPV17882.1 hypothetical protein CLAFUW4_20068 [Fulvia fulva]WPV33623.1 hypothetical protein CLAFUW7_20068 [Fulvia fulva]
MNFLHAIVAMLNIAVISNAAVVSYPLEKRPRSRERAYRTGASCRLSVVGSVRISTVIVSRPVVEDGRAEIGTWRVQARCSWGGHAQ